MITKNVINFVFDKILSNYPVFILNNSSLFLKCSKRGVHDALVNHIVKWSEEYSDFKRLIKEYELIQKSDLYSEFIDDIDLMLNLLNKVDDKFKVFDKFITSNDRISLKRNIDNFLVDDLSEENLLDLGNCFDNLIGRFDSLMRLDSFNMDVSEIRELYSKLEGIDDFRDLNARKVLNRLIIRLEYIRNKCDRGSNYIS